MVLDVELYRRTVYAPAGPKSKQLRRISVIDIAPEGYTHTLVLVHGYGGHALQWIYQLRAFGTTMRVIAPDLRGHGGSDDPAELPTSMDGLLEDLEIVLNAVVAERPFAMLAHSFGGAVAVDYALRHPDEVSGVVLIGVPARFEIQPGTRLLMSMPNGVYTFVRDRFHLPLFANQIRTLRRLHDKAMHSWPGPTQLEQVRAPTLVITGERDSVFLRRHYEDVTKLVPGAKSVVIPVSSHLVQLERPEAVNRAIRRFLEPRSVGASGGGVPPWRLRPPGTFGAAAPGSKPLGARSLATRIAEMPWLQAYDAEVPVDLPVPRMLLHDLLNNAANDYPDRAALVYFAERISFRELDRLSNRFARALRAIGITKGERVALVLPNVPQCVIGFFGALKAGAVVVLASPLTTEEAIASHLKDSGARALLTLTSYQDLVTRVVPGSAIQHVIFTDVREYLPVFERVALASRIEALVRQPAVPSAPAPTNGAAATYKRHSLQQLLRSQAPSPVDSGTTSDDLALLQYTSGTVDPPRGVMLTHRNLVANVAQVRHWIPEARRGRETLLCVLPLAHSYGITSGLHLCMALGGSLVLLPTTRIQAVVEAIKQYHPSIFPGVPALYLAIANYPKIRSYGVSSIKYCVSGSAPLPVEVQESFEKLTRGRLVEGYGLTEASPVTHSNPLEGERHVGSIGVPLPGTNARIVDVQTGDPLPTGEIGELVIAGPQVMRGYWGLPEETAQTFIGGWLRTGDLARMDDDGYFTIVDRKKDVILSGPYNVYPREVEEVLYEHPKVLEAAVVGQPDMTDGSGSSSRLIKAVIVLRRGEKATPEELMAYLRERIDSYKLPQVIEFRDELPKNFVGKVLRRLLVRA